MRTLGLRLLLLGFGHITLRLLVLLLSFSLVVFLLVGFWRLLLFDGVAFGFAILILHSDTIAHIYLTKQTNM